MPYSFKVTNYGIGGLCEQHLDSQVRTYIYIRHKDAGPRVWGDGLPRHSFDLGSRSLPPSFKGRESEGVQEIH